MQQLTFGCEQVECWRHQLSSPHESNTRRDPTTKATYNGHEQIFTLTVAHLYIFGCLLAKLLGWY